MGNNNIIMIDFFQNLGKYCASWLFNMLELFPILENFYFLQIHFINNEIIYRFDLI